ncbi:NEQ257 [Nanoarchaeum equitans Kin4-M]|uniref:Large ribosomal subunit protein uL24 n=1 Tax=Nanoarchaeum equitans (strain Kin4-M) TaxID=228908 RepID=RL24_NANEQ|nr:RecName: Full=Large ribosomal subunit protein uL24; AltName: Full=50S ribosomal protein L24 [Nanoarchaeum equitans Kin4-M]AAR39109.1 NEQ257 [Nanoarchaeum equitans Kin4-M]
MLKIRNYNPSDWSPSWVRSKQPRKQRKYIINAPLHRRRKMMRSPLSKELREKLGIRNVPIKVGDVVRVERGNFRGKEGQVIDIDPKYYRVYLSLDTDRQYPFHPSKLTIIKLDLSDKKRREALKIDDSKYEELKKEGLAI